MGSRLPESIRFLGGYYESLKIKGFGINHSEIFTREGKSPGVECVGEVVQSSTPALSVGQKVVFSIMGEK